MRNKYTNKALKQKDQHYNDYNGNIGYIAVDKGYGILKALNWLAVFVIIVIVCFHYFTK